MKIRPRKRKIVRIRNNRSEVFLVDIQKADEAMKRAIKVSIARKNGDIDRELFIKHVTS